MATVTLGPFPGLAPRYSRSRQGANFADTAIDVDLSDGTLRPWYENLPIANTTTHNGYFCGCDFLDLLECEVAIEHFGYCKQTVISGAGSNTIGACNEDRCDIRVPCPPNAPTVTGGATTLDRDTQRTQYAYTYKTSNGHETSLSFQSNPVLSNPTTPIILSDFVTPPITQCVTEICIYRLMTGYRGGAEDQREDLTGWIRIGSIPVGTLSYTDTVTDVEGCEANITNGRMEAPEGLCEIQSFGAGDRLFSYTEDTLHQSMPGEPHWWPIEFQTSLHQTITGVAVHNNFAAAFTPEGVYLVPPADPATMTCQEPLFCGDAPRPLISHDSRRWLKTKTSIMYVSDEGIIELSGDGSWRNITENWFSTEDWRSMAPETMRIGYDHKRLFLTSDTHSYILTLNGENSQLTEFSDFPERYLTSPTGELLLLQNGQVAQFNSGDLRREGKWGKLARTKISRYRQYQVDTNGIVKVSINGAETTMAGKCTLGKLGKYKKSVKQNILIRTKDELFKLNLASSQGELLNAPF